MKKVSSITVIMIGAVLFLVGLFTAIPSNKLTTYGILREEYSVIEEYVGGDAYNYIIGASLVGGEIAGAKTEKAIFTATGILLICIGLLALTISSERRSMPANTKEFSIQRQMPETVEPAVEKSV